MIKPGVEVFFLILIEISCAHFRLGECKCLDPKFNWTTEQMNQTVQAYQQAQYNLTDYFEKKALADNKTDFTFVIQPFIADAFNPAMNVSF